MNDPARLFTSFITESEARELDKAAAVYARIVVGLTMGEISGDDHKQADALKAAMKQIAKGPKELVADLDALARARTLLGTMAEALSPEHARRQEVARRDLLAHDEETERIIMERRLERARLDDVLGRVSALTFGAINSAPRELESLERRCQLVSLLRGRLLNPPPAPTSLAGKGSGPGEITLNWAGADGATGYRIARCDGSETMINGRTTFVDRGLKPGDQCTFRVAAERYGVVGPYSDPVSIAVPPDEPQGLSVQEQSRSVTLTWKPATGQVTAYHIERGSPGEPGRFTQVATVKGTTWTDKNVHPGHSLLYRVRAECDGSVGGYAEIGARTLHEAETMPRVQEPARMQ